MSQSDTRTTAKNNQTPPELRMWVKNHTTHPENIKRATIEHTRRGWHVTAFSFRTSELPDGYTVVSVSQARASYDRRSTVQIRETQ
jgi:hypothetical protein